MVGHPAPGMDEPVEPPPCVREHVEKQPPVADCPKDVLTSVAARGDVVHRTGKSQSQGLGHEHKSSLGEAQDKT
jgi:hypothetical protein